MHICRRKFKSVFTSKDTSQIPDKGPSPFSIMDNIVISPRGVHKLLSNLNAHKATGPDAISARFLKELAEEITPALTFFFRMSLEGGQVPDDWRIAHVVPIFKKGDKSAAANYRPVDLFQNVGTYPPFQHHGPL